MAGCCRQVIPAGVMQAAIEREDSGAVNAFWRATSPSAPLSSTQAVEWGRPGREGYDT